MIVRIKSFFHHKIPPLSNWLHLPYLLNKKERIIFWSALCFFITSLIVLFFALFFSKTERVPTFGGNFSEGMVGQPRFFNPIYSLANDVDRDITELLFSELMTYDFEQGLFVPALIEKIAYVNDEKTSIKIRLRDNLRWSDGKKITATDLVFTVKTIQDPEFKSPLRPSWIGVQVEQTSELEATFYLEHPSVAFQNKLFSLRIIPHHIWQNISAPNFPLSKYNLNSIGSGPYRVQEIIKDNWDNIEKIRLEVNPYYHGKRPYLEQISFIFFRDEEEKVLAAQRKEIDSFALINPKNYQEIIKQTKTKIHFFQMPRYFALFFNLEKENISEKEIRTALNLAIDRELLIKDVLAGRGKKVDSPLPSEIYEIALKNNSEFNPQRAAEILDSLGFFRNETGFRSKTIREKGVIKFEQDLQTGDQGEKVRNLQNCLLLISKDDNEIFPQGRVTGFFGQETRVAVIRLQEKYREEILAPSGLTRGTGQVGSKTRQKLNELCGQIPAETINLNLTITTVDQPMMIKTAQAIKAQWEYIGIETNIKVYDNLSLEREVIKPRNYSILLFGKAFEAVPDLFPFWHSSQKSEFGLNLAMYANEEVDSILELLRTEQGPEKREELFKNLDNIITNDRPAVFLYNPDYLYFVAPRILGINSGKTINPSGRFSGIEHWYAETKRIIKR